MAWTDGLDGLGQQAADLERGLGSAEAVTVAFGEALGQMRESIIYTGREVGTLGTTIGRSLRGAFEDVVYDGGKLSDALRGVAQTMSEAAFRVAVKPVEQAVGTTVSEGLNAALSGLFPFARGGAFAQGRVMPFAKGGVVSAATSFPMRGATGLMGEAGPEAIMPLMRGADGRLGVQASASAARPVNVVMNVTTPDVSGFARSQGQIAQKINQMLARGQRNA